MSIPHAGTTESTNIADQAAIIVTTTALPDELLIPIFEHLIEDAIEMSRKEIECPQNIFALTLSWVCKRWRSFIQGTPSLWRYIPLALPQPTKKAGAINLIDHYLSYISKSQTIVFHWSQGFIPHPVRSPSDTHSTWEATMSTYRSYKHMEPISYYKQNGSIEAVQRLDLIQEVELLGRNRHNYPILCDIPATSYILGRLRARFTDEIGYKISVLCLSMPELHIEDLEYTLEQLSSLSSLHLYIQNSYLLEYPEGYDAIGLGPHDNLGSLSACARVVSQFLEYSFGTPILTRLTLDEQVHHHFKFDEGEQEQEEQEQNQEQEQEQDRKKQDHDDYDDYDDHDDYDDYDSGLYSFTRDFDIERTYEYHEIHRVKDLWNRISDACHLDTIITHLTLAGNPSQEFAKTYTLPRISSWAGVKYLTLRGDNLSPVLEAMEADGGVLPNVMELVLEQTDITGNVIRSLIDARQYGETQEVPRGNRIEKLVLDRCKGVDRAFCEDMVRRVDKLVVYC
jgi:hypothetical protein